MQTYKEKQDASEKELVDSDLSVTLAGWALVVYNIDIHSIP